MNNYWRVFLTLIAFFATASSVFAETRSWRGTGNGDSPEEATTEASYQMKSYFQSAFGRGATFQTFGVKEIVKRSGSRYECFMEGNASRTEPAVEDVPVSSNSAEDKTTDSNSISGKNSTTESKEVENNVADSSENVDKNSNSDSRKADRRPSGLNSTIDGNVSVVGSDGSWVDPYDARPLVKGWPCTDYVAKILSGRGLDLKEKIPGTSRSVNQAIQMTMIDAKDITGLETKINSDDRWVKGVVNALTSTNQGKEIQSLKSLRAGDIVQYWWKDRDKHGNTLWFGHAAIVKSVDLTSEKPFKLNAVNLNPETGERLQKTWTTDLGGAYRVFAVRPQIKARGQ